MEDPESCGELNGKIAGHVYVSETLIFEVDIVVRTDISSGRNELNQRPEQLAFSRPSSLVLTFSKTYLPGGKQYRKYNSKAIYLSRLNLHWGGGGGVNIV